MKITSSSLKSGLLFLILLVAASVAARLVRAGVLRDVASADWLLTCFVLLGIAACTRWMVHVISPETKPVVHWKTEVGHLLCFGCAAVVAVGRPEVSWVEWILYPDVIFAWLVFFATGVEVARRQD
jgi:hypothetical protein